MSEALARRVLELADVGEVRLRPLGGGDIGAAYQADTPNGRLCVKVARPGLGTDFEAEAEGLRQMAAACRILRIPDVLVSDEVGLVLEFVEGSRPSRDFDERLAEGLAEMHRATRPSYGFERRTYCGATPQPNPWTSSWVEFYVEHRIRHQIRSMKAAGRIGPAAAHRFEAWAQELPARLMEPLRPGLIHGDLWSGNILSDGEGRPVIFDPAAYYGCPEAELGMLTWMGGRSGAFYATYAEAAQLPADWRDRAEVYRAYHVMNHATLFGGGYIAQALALAHN
ncbi:MAG: fructosamine kinase family protein [Myxococcota bacterium]